MQGTVIVTIGACYVTGLCEKIGNALRDTLNAWWNLPKPSDFVLSPPWVNNEEASEPESCPAPGRPTEDDGFKSPKKPRGDEGKDGRVRNPNGQGKGWRDSKGNVWIPTGGKAAHGGEHWDVQTPGGGYINIYPGGRRR